MSCEQRADALNDIFNDRLVPLLKVINVATVNDQVQEQLYY